jgi:hypothetical protein
MPLLRLQLINCMQMLCCVPVLVLQSMMQPSCSLCNIQTSCLYQQACLCYSYAAAACGMYWGSA